MSTVRLTSLYEQPSKKVKANIEFDKTNEFSMFEETLQIVKNPDHLSKIIEEDCMTQYGWSKIAASNEPKKSLSTTAANSSQYQWDDSMHEEPEPKERQNLPQDETIFINQLGLHNISSLHMNKNELEPS